MKSSMNSRTITGIFGKLPAHGDFIHRNLPSQVINDWDAWLQTFIGSSQERLGDAWLDIYLTSPIWRFSMSSGVLSEQAWVGILLPSVDRVGRYYPFSVMQPAPAGALPTQLLCSKTSWFEAIELAALQALDGQLLVDRLMQMPGLADAPEAAPYCRANDCDLGKGLIVERILAQSSPLDTMPYFLDSLLYAELHAYSVWSTAGSDCVEPCTMVTAGMPAPGAATALLDGQWQDWDWNVPMRPSR